jgi:hypothetical protein
MVAHNNIYQSLQITQKSKLLHGLIKAHLMLSKVNQ